MLERCLLTLAKLIDGDLLRFRSSRKLTARMSGSVVAFSLQFSSRLDRDAPELDHARMLCGHSVWRRVRVSLRQLGLKRPPQTQSLINKLAALQPLTDSAS